MNEKDNCNRRKEYRPNPTFPNEDIDNLYFYFCKNETYEYMDLQHRISSFAEIIPIPNFYPYDSTINVQIKISKKSPAVEWLQYVLPYKAKAMVSILGINIHAFACYLLDYIPFEYAELKKQEKIVLEDSVRELMNYFSCTKEELYERILEFYGSEIIWEKFCYTQEQSSKYHSVWNRPQMLPREYNESYEAWYNITWKSEMSLYNLVKAYYPDAMFHYNDKSLGKQHLDIYSNAGRIAFEYQGKQHYEGIDYFGGEKGFLYRKNLDSLKKNLCKTNGITLIEWKYDVPIFPVYLLQKLRENNIHWEIVPSIFRKMVWEDMTSITQKNIMELETNNKTNMIKVIRRFGMDGTFEKEYNTIEEAVYDTKLSKGGIEKVIYGERKTCGGYIWKKVVKESEN